MISVPGAEKLSLVEIEAFLAASESVRFAGCGRAEMYIWVERLLCHHEYPLQKRRAKGLLRAYVACMTAHQPGAVHAADGRLFAHGAGRLQGRVSASSTAMWSRPTIPCGAFSVSRVQVA